MNEIEAKILEVNVENVVKRLEEINGEKIFEGEIITYIFDTKDDKLKNSNNLLRIRDVGGKIILGMKIGKSRKKVKAAEEYEVEVKGFEVTKRILEALGYNLKQTIKKHRISYRLGDCRIDIDKIKGIPPFLEIESCCKEKITKCAQSIGFSENSLKPWTVFDVLKRYK